MSMADDTTQTINKSRCSAEVDERKRNACDSQPKTQRLANAVKGIAPYSDSIYYGVQRWAVSICGPHKYYHLYVPVRSPFAGKYVGVIRCLQEIGHRESNMNWLSLRIASGINRCKIIKNYCFEKIERQTKKKKRITNGVVWWRLRESILCYMQCYIGVRNMSVTIATGTRDFYFGIYTQLKSLDNRPNRIDFF